jgi:catechol 2,3-dioxygenase-like lactoylglutathione lyase family enzyme
MRQRVTVITLGVRDLARARRFYEALGWQTGAEADDDVVFFQVGDMVLSLWDRSRLAEDSRVQDAPGWGGVTLALNLGSPEEVDAATEQARAAGATIGREPAETFWGGYSSVFIDPEGHPWEIAHNPHWTLTSSGGVKLG